MGAGSGDAPRADVLPGDPRSVRVDDQLLASYSGGSISTSGGNAVDTAGQQTANDNGDDSVCRPATLFVLAFSDLTYSVKRRPMHRNVVVEPTDTTATTGGEWGRSRMNTLLDGISGQAREGEIMAVLGASGAGKSTLIDALAGRIQRESLSGAVTLNGDALDSRLLRVISAHVMQDDLLYPMLTVSETLMYLAEFRLPRSLSASRKRSRVEALIDQLGLRDAANTIIGDEGRRGVSGGERRRVSIGIDIIHDPIILFLDEPTSGLDSTSAFMVVKVLQRIAQSGSVVVMSIHQPSYRILCLLDRLLLLSQGQVVYYGPPATLPLFFSELGQPIPDRANPAEFALDHIRELEGTQAGTHELVELTKSWQEKQQFSAGPFDGKPSLSLKEAVRLSIARGKLVSGASASSDGGTPTQVVPYANPWWVEVRVLMRREFTSARRTPKVFLWRLGAVVVTALIQSTIFWRLDDTPKSVNERFSFFVLAVSTMYYSSLDALPVFVKERYIFLRETAHNTYRRSSYTMSNAMVSFPPLIFLSIAFTAITFFAVGLAGGAEGFIFFTLIVLASFWAGSGFVTFLSGVVPNVIVGYTVAGALLASFGRFSGFYITRDRIPDYWIWFHYISLLKYPYEAVLQNEFGADPGKCFLRGTQMLDGTPMGKLSMETQLNVLNTLPAVVNFNSTSCITTGADILAKQAVNQLGKWGCLWVTVAWGFLYRALFYLTLLLGSRNRRR